MGQTTFPIPSSGATPTSTFMPTNATSVILDGQLTTSSYYTTTITNSNSGNVILAAQNAALDFEINGAHYYCPANSSVFGPVVNGTVSATISNATGVPVGVTNVSLPSLPASTVFAIGYNAGYWHVLTATTTGYYSTNGTTWTAMTQVASTGSLQPTSSAYCNGAWIYPNVGVTSYNYSTTGTVFSSQTFPAAEHAGFFLAGCKLQR